MDFAFTDAAYFYSKPSELEKCIQRFLAKDFNFNVSDPADQARIDAFGKRFNEPENELSAYGIYPLSEAGLCCYVIYHKAYCEKIGRESVIVALNTDINLFADDPIQDIVSRMDN